MAANPYGLFAPRRRRRFAEQAELERQEAIAGIDIGVDEIIASTADPEEAAAYQDQFDNFKGMAMSPDPELQRAGFQGLQTMAGAVRDAIDRKHAAQEGFIIEHARELRERHVKATEPMRQIQSQMEQLNTLLADPEFDQNLALNRGYLIELLNGTTRQMLSDPADFADAMMMSGGGGLIGSLVKLAGGTLAAEDFNFSKDDYGRIARAMYTYTEKRYRETVAPIELEAAALEQASAGLEFLPPGYSLTRYVTTSPQEFADPLQPDYGTGPVPPSAKDVAGSALDALTGDAGGGDPDNAARQPFAFSGVSQDDAGFLARAFGVADNVEAELNAEIARYTGQGAAVKADPATGDLYAIFPDGRREALPSGQLERKMVLGQLARDAKRPRSGFRAGRGF